MFIAHSYDKKTGIWNGAQKCESESDLPPFHTFLEPLPDKDGYDVVFDGEKWRYKLRPRVKLPPLTSEKAKIVGRMGGLKAAQNRRERKAMKDVIEARLNEKLSNGKTVQENLIERAEKLCFGNQAKLTDLVKFLEFLRDTAGQKPVARVAQKDTAGNDVPKNDLSKVDTATLIEMAKAAGVADDDAGEK